MNELQNTKVMRRNYEHLFIIGMYGDYGVGKVWISFILNCHKL